MATSKPVMTDRLRIAPTSIVDIVSERLRAEVIRGTLPPGEPLQISALSERLGVSHIPVREALRQLESEGLIERHHGRGAVVTAVTADRLRDIFRLRRMIEPEIAARAVELLTDEQIAELEVLLDQLYLDPGASIEEIERVGRAHDGFHRSIVVPAASEWDYRVLNMLWQASERSVGHVFMTWAEHDRDYMMREIHEPLFRAAAERDPAKMRAAVERHLIEGVDQLADALEAS